MEDNERKLEEYRAKYMGKLVRLIDEGDPCQDIGVVESVERHRGFARFVPLAYIRIKTGRVADYFFDHGGWTLEIYGEAP